jgi:hypothetical protein
MYSTISTAPCFPRSSLTHIGIKDSGTFNKIHHALSSELYLPLTDETIPFEKYETGALTKGISDPSRDAYNSLADYYYGQDFVEIRLRWLLLNIMDPSSKMMMNDFNGSRTFNPTPYQSIHLGVGNAVEPITFGRYTYDEWLIPTYHERLKESYYIVKDTFADID